ncbi:salivary cystatin-L2 [Rhipicephalus sanguineus]|uniref:salivary cystatin-L2 n=1 Tax=Rhipicephalus sanguineus TaxID=34632 RepID=UPI001896094B|nr:salivary cystatin-L2 [Rhipicephalus sanguineus]
MVPSRIGPFGIGMFLVATFVLSASESPTLRGGWKRKQVGEDAIFDELAHYAISQQVSDREFFDTVLELVEVETQTVAGTNYRIKFKTAESTCRVGEVYNKEVCLPRTRETVKDTCTAVIYDVPWLSERSLTSFNCEGTNTSK